MRNAKIGPDLRLVQIPAGLLPVFCCCCFCFFRSSYFYSLACFSLFYLIALFSFARFFAIKYLQQDSVIGQYVSCLSNWTVGPFIRGKIRPELYHLYEHVLFKTRTARINGSRLISVLDWFSCECCPQQRQSNVARQKFTHAYYAFASYVRREGHLYEVFLVLAKTRLI